MRVFVSTVRGPGVEPLSWHAATSLPLCLQRRCVRRAWCFCAGRSPPWPWWITSVWCGKPSSTSATMTPPRVRPGSPGWSPPKALHLLEEQMLLPLGPLARVQARKLWQQYGSPGRLALVHLLLTLVLFMVLTS